MRKFSYPDEWPQIARAVKDACGWTCQVCDRKCRRPGEFNLGWEYQLSVAHWDGDYDSEAVFVVACCLPCHFLHDAPFSWMSRRRHLRWRRYMAGQLAIELT